jgi:alcohol dehydrogenase
MLLKVPESLDPITATLFNPLGAGIRWGAQIPGTSTGDVVAVLGPGIRGLCAVVAARQAGAEFVLVTGAGIRDRPRLETARAFGADLVVDVTKDDPARELMRAVGRGADIVIDVTARAPDALDQAVRLVRPEGTVVVAGIRGGPITSGFNADLLVYKEIRILGALGVDVIAYQSALDLLASTSLPFTTIDRGVVGFEDLSSLLDSMSRGGIDTPIHAVVVPD